MLPKQQNAIENKRLVMCANASIHSHSRLPTGQDGDLTGLRHSHNQTEATTIHIMSQTTKICKVSLIATFGWSQLPPMIQDYGQKETVR